MIFWVAALICLGLDQATKHVVMTQMQLYDVIELIPGFFQFNYVTNKGAAFSMFSESGEWLKWVSLVVSLGIASIGCFGGRLNRWEQLGYGCILGGAIGNGIDRFAYGHVIDFLDFELINFPVFNIADVSINIGLFFMFLALLRSGTNGNSDKNGKGRSLDHGNISTDEPQDQ
ncbi:signal peptidase II [Thalassoporum mexicanum]